MSHAVTRLPPCEWRYTAAELEIYLTTYLAGGETIEMIARGAGRPAGRLGKRLWHYASETGRAREFLATKRDVSRLAKQAAAGNTAEELEPLLTQYLDGSASIRALAARHGLSESMLYSRLRLLAIRTGRLDDYRLAVRMARQDARDGHAPKYRGRKAAS